MHHFFVEEGQLSDERHVLRLTGTDHHHIAHVLRMKPGEELSVSIRGGDGTEYRFGIEEITAEEVICGLRFIREEKAELNAQLILMQCLPKSDKIEMIIEKAVELGASKIIPVRSARSVVRLDDKKEKSKAVRWQAKADAASKQSRRGKLTHVAMPCSFTEALEQVKDADVKLVAYELEDSAGIARTREILSAIPAGSRVAVLVGPEGGLAVEEVEAAIKSGFETVTMGRRILRTETAGLTMLSWLMLFLEDK